MSIHNISIYTNETSKFFAVGWAAGAAVIAAGKAYIVLSGSKGTIHGLLGHCGKPSFRRELAVGAAAFNLIGQFVFTLAENYGLSEYKSGICATALAVPGAVLAGMYATRYAYTPLKYMAISCAVARVGIALFNSLQRPKAGA